MSEVTINNSPIHSDTILTAVYGEEGPNWARFHTGTDFAPYGDTPANPGLYSVCDGTVVDVIEYTGSQALGNQVIIRDSDTGYYWRYCHMRDPASVNINDTVSINTRVGYMGMTGNATGVHLHLEYSTSQIWSYDNFLNPSTALGIPNERGTIVHFGESPTPTPVEETKKKGWKWQIWHRCKYL